MRIIKPSTLRGWWRAYPHAETPLKAWLAFAKTASWQSIMDVRKTFPHADAVKVSSSNIVTVFNIGGGDFRLIVAIKYKSQTVYIRDFMTHSEYSNQHWKARH